MKPEPVLDLQNIKELRVIPHVIGGSPPNQNADDAILSLLFFDEARLVAGCVGKMRMTKPQFEEIVRLGTAFFGRHVRHLEKEAHQE